MPGIFTVSLDLELYWGVRDARSIESYESNLRGEREAIRGMLELFEEHDIHATWATLGFLFYKDAEELRHHLPDVLPDYRRQQLSSYRYLQEHAWGSDDDHFHFAPEMVQLIRDYDGQEIGTHTFSHYYCLEDGQTLEAFRADLKAALAAAQAHGIPTASLVFPRNQSNPEYLAVLDELGIACYRGNENAAFYAPRNQREQNLIVRASRLLDAYVNLSGYHTYALQDCARSRPFNIPSSRIRARWRCWKACACAASSGPCSTRPPASGCSTCGGIRTTSARISSTTWPASPRCSATTVTCASATACSRSTWAK